MTDTAPTKLRFAEGDEVRAIGTDFDLRVGAAYVVEFAYDDAFEEIGEPVYSLSQPDIGSAGMEGRESHLELVRTAAQMNARKLPTTQDIVRAVPIGWEWGDDLNINESDVDGDDAIELYGKTADGLPFGFRLRVDHIWHTDF